MAGLDHLWETCGATVTGPLHIKNNIPNQDCWMARHYKWGNVVVVSDGLGSKKHSDRGSKAACYSVFEAAKQYQNNPEANIVDILRLIQAYWLIKIAPFAPEECLATCLFALQTEESIILGRLGDGMIVAFGETEENALILCDNKQDAFSNLTNSLQQEFRPCQWKFETLETALYHAIILCTDGISDDLLPEKRLLFAQELYATYIDIEAKKRKRDIQHWLKAWPVSGHSDDKTLACLFKKKRNVRWNKIL